MIPDPASMMSYNWFPGNNGNGGGASLGPLEPQDAIVEYNFVTDINGWTNPAKYTVTPDLVYVGPIILPPAFPAIAYLVRARVILGDGGGELYVFLDRGKRYFSTGKPHGSETGATLQDVTTLYYNNPVTGPFADKWDFLPVLFDRANDGLTVNFVPASVTSWLNVEFSYLVAA